MSGSIKTLIDRESYPIISNTNYNSQSQFQNIIESKREHGMRLIDDFKKSKFGVGRIIGEDTRENWMVRNTYESISSAKDKKALSSTDTYQVPMINQIENQIDIDNARAINREILRNRRKEFW